MGGAARNTPRVATLADVAATVARKCLRVVDFMGLYTESANHYRSARVQRIPAVSVWRSEL